jgi:hypothetical protein
VRFVERAPLPVGVDRGARDGDERSGIEREQPLRVRRFERNDVDDEIEAVRDGKRLIVVAVKLDEVELVERRRSISCAKRDLPLVVAERMCDRCTDAAGSTDDECAPCDRLGAHHIADADLAAVKDVGVEPASMRESLDHARFGHRL